MNFDSKTMYGFFNGIYGLLYLILCILAFVWSSWALVNWGSLYLGGSYLFLGIFLGRRGIFDEDGDPIDNGEE